MGTDTLPEAQRKRTLEALERRFAAAKVELLQQQGKNKKLRSNEEDRKEPHTANTSSIATSGCLTDAPRKPSLNTSSNKDMEANDPTYSKLLQPVHENLLTTSEKLSSRKGSIVDKILHELLQHGDSAQKYIQGSRSMKIDNYILLDNYVQGRGISVGSHIRALRIHTKRSKKHMSMKQHKKCGSFDLPEDLHKFNIFTPMHEMWKSYMMQLVKNIGKNQLAQCLLDADLHGAIILVAECKITTFTGVSGIMIRETAETFGIITRDDKFQVVPKKASVFILQIDCWKVVLYGDKLTSRDLGL